MFLSRQSHSSSAQYFSPKPPSLTIGMELNRGAYGTVHSGQLDGKPVAIKQIHLLLLKAAKEQGDFSKMMSDFQSECQLLEQLKHPHVVAFKGAFFDGTTEAPLLVMELMRENLQQYLNRKQGLLSQLEQLQICIEIVNAVCFLHERTPPLMHRDLNDKNILLSSDGTIKIGDLGQSKLKMLDHLNTVQPGAMAFMPPEALQQHSCYDEKLDIFSLGVLMLEVATQQPPRVNMYGSGFIPELKRREKDLAKLGGDHPLRPLIISCLEDNPKKRPDIVKVRSKLLSIAERVKRKCADTTAGHLSKEVQNPALFFQTAQLLQSTSRLCSEKLPDLPIATASTTAIAIARDVYVCGGSCCDAALGQLVQVYNMDRRKWSKLPPAPQLHSEATAIFNKLVLIGGEDASSCTVTNLVSTWTGQCWQQDLPPMPTKRLRPGVTTYGNIVIVAGGWADVKRLLSTIDVLVIHMHQWWTPVCLQLPQPMSGLTITTCGTNIYVAGAFIHCTTAADIVQTSNRVWQLPMSKFSKVLANADQSLPLQWAKIADTPNYRSALLQGTAHLVAIGGHNQLDQPTSDIAIYNPCTNTWSTVGHLHTPRDRCSVASFSRLSFLVIGGCSNIRDVIGNLLNSVERIHIQTQTGTK